jgi:peptidoglycan/xylan/chitin deacetylase (PgdA/CDA1 family)
MRERTPYRRTGAWRRAWVAAALAAAAVVLLVDTRPAGAGRGGGRLASGSGAPGARAAILAYHRFGPVVADSMTVRTSTLRWQLEYLKRHDYPVIPLRRWIAWRLRQGPAPPPRAVILTVDDGHRSVFSDMLPLVREFRVPVTLFIYPSAISNATYAMTWDQLRTLTATGLFDVQSHSYWHPNLRTEKRRLAPGDYRAFVLTQLTRSRAAIAERMGADVDVVAWPFGIHDDELECMAVEAGYVAGVTIDRRMAAPDDPLMALPRFLMTDAGARSLFTALLPPEAP